MNVRTIGRHRVSCGDVNEGIDELLQGDTAEIMYTDPPWGDGAIKMFATMNKKATGQVITPTPLDTFLHNVFNIAAESCSAYLLVEYGIRWEGMIRKMGEQAGFARLHLIDTCYRGKGHDLPLHLHVFAKEGYQTPSRYAQGVSGTKGYRTLQCAVQPLVRSLRSDAWGLDELTILDPCCGLGFSAQIAVDCNARFLGNELNQKRLDKTIARLVNKYKAGVR